MFNKFFFLKILFYKKKFIILHNNLEKSIILEMNKYEILGVVGEGAYGVVLKCRNR